MKNIVENLAVFLVGVLSLGIVYLIFEYYMIEEKGLEEVEYVMPKTKSLSKKEQTKAYLKSLQGYGEDVDVKVDKSSQTPTNRVVVTSEESHSELSDVLEGSEKLRDVNSAAQQKMLKDIGLAIDAALDEM